MRINRSDEDSRRREVIQLFVMGALSLAAEVKFIDRRRVHGFVWRQGIRQSDLLIEMYKAIPTLRYIKDEASNPRSTSCDADFRARIPAGGQRKEAMEMHAKTLLASPKRGHKVRSL